MIKPSVFVDLGMDVVFIWDFWGECETALIGDSVEFGSEEMRLVLDFNDGSYSKLKLHKPSFFGSKRIVSV